MRALLAGLLLAACAPPAPQIPAPLGCEDNTPPFIGNLTMDSTCEVGEPVVDCGSEEGQDAIEAGEEPIWSLIVGFLYADPGVEGAGDPPNMVGGMISGELSLGQFTSFWLYDPVDFNPGEDPTYVPVDREATSGELLLPILIPEIRVDYYSPATINLRVRDGCDVPSNEIGCRYLMGTGEWLNCVPPAAPPDE